MISQRTDSAVGPGVKSFVEAQELTEMVTASASCARISTIPSRILRRALAWIEYIDPGAHRRIKGLRLVTAYGIAAMLGTLLGGSHGLLGGALLGPLAGGFALWASVFEGQATRASSSRDLTLLSVAAVVGAVTMIGFSPYWIALAGPAPNSRLSPELSSSDS